MFVQFEVRFLLSRHHWVVVGLPVPLSVCKILALLSCVPFLLVTEQERNNLKVRVRDDATFVHAYHMSVARAPGTPVCL